MKDATIKLIRSPACSIPGILSRGFGLLLLLSTLIALHSTCSAQGTAFTYQGRLSDNGAPANGSYDLQFTVFGALSGGSPVAGSITNSATAVSNGLFTVTLDFGAGLFTGAGRWLEISVRTNGSGGFATLSARQPLTPSPYALYAAGAGSLESGGLRGLQVMALTPTPSYSNVVDIVGGSPINGASGNAATVSGGGATINGFPFPNLVVADMGTIGGGAYNTVISGYGTVGGGWNNQATGFQSCTVSGGFQNLASGNGSTVSGGVDNTASGDNSTVPGGTQNFAGGLYSFAAGQQAQALHQGAFVWADSQNAVFASTSNDSFNVRAGGGVRFVTGGAGLLVDGQSPALRAGGNTFTGPNVFSSGLGIRGPVAITNTASGSGVTLQNGNNSTAYYINDATGERAAYALAAFAGHFSGDALPGDMVMRASGGKLLLQSGGSAAAIVITTNNNVGIGTNNPTQKLYVAGNIVATGTVTGSSDRNAKENFVQVDPREVLDKVARLPISRWNYRQDQAQTHLGPMAQDFYAAFALGMDDRHISMVDADGVALAAIQGLNQKLEETRAENVELKRRLTTLEQIILKQKSN